MDFKALLEEVVSYYSEKEKYVEEIKLAKESYLEQTGIVYEDDPQYEMRLAAFTEWFAFDRELDNLGIPPVRAYHEMFVETFDLEKKQQLQRLCQTKHSLFRLTSIQKEIFQIEDLFDASSYSVLERRNYAGVSKGDVFEARLVKIGESWVFSGCFCVHPREVAAMIVDQSRKGDWQDKQAFKDFVFSLEKKRLRYDQYKRIEASKIYASEGKLN